MRRAKSLVVPVTLFVLTTLGAWFSGDLSNAFEGADSISSLVTQTLLSGVWLSAAFLAIRLIDNFIWDGFAKDYLGTTVPRLIRDMISFLILMIACAGIAGVVFKQNITGLLATSGILGIVIGFSVQSIILDVVTGLAIHIDRPFDIGDWISMLGEEPLPSYAKVLEINWRTTRLKTEANELIIVPNSVLGKMVVSNTNRPELPTRFEVEIELDFHLPIERCRRLLLASVKGATGVLEEPSPVVLVGETTDRGLKYVVRYWIEPWNPHSPSVAKDLVMTNIVANMQYAGLNQGEPKLVNMDPRAGQSHFGLDVDAGRASILRKLSIFQSLQDMELEQLAAAAAPQRFRESETIIRQGDTGDSMYVLVEGLLNVYRNTEGKDETRIARMQPGRYFGEMSLLTGEPRSATIRAAIETVVLKIEKSAMVDLLSQRARLADELSRSIAENRLSDKNREASSANNAEAQTVSLADQIKNKIVAFFKIIPMTS